MVACLLLSSCGKCSFKVVSHNRGVWSNLKEPEVVSALFGLVEKLFTHMKTLNQFPDGVNTNSQTGSEAKRR